MTLKMDNAGRIVLPKTIRDRLGLRSGTDLEVVESDEGLILKPITLKSAMTRVKGFWVHQGEASPGLDWSRLSDQERKDRHRKVFGS
jgi:AbrB family looped-hinge helix DNA binding protein